LQFLEKRKKRSRVRLECVFFSKNILLIAARTRKKCFRQNASGPLLAFFQKLQDRERARGGIGTGRK